MDALALYWGHSEQMEHFKAFAEPVRELRGVLLRPEVRASVQEKAGVDGLNALQGWVSTLENDGHQSAMALLALEKVSQRMQNAVSITALGWNVGTAIKNMLSTLNAVYEMPLGAYTRGLGKFAAGKLDLTEIFNSPMIQRRLESGVSPEHRQVIAGFRAAHPGNWFTYWAKWFVQGGMEIHGLSDALGNTISAAIHFDWSKGEAMKTGLDEEQATRAAMKATQRMIDRTAQPVELADRSLIEAKAASAPTMRWFLMFMSEARQKMALYGMALSHALTGKATAKDWRTLVVAHVVMPLATQTAANIIRDSFDDDDRELFDDELWNGKDYARAMLLGPLMGTPMLGTIANGLLSYLTGRPAYRNNPTDPINALLPRIENKIADAFDDKEPEPIERGVEAVSAAMNLVSVASALHPAGDTLQFMGPAGNVMKQAFLWLDNAVPDTESEADQMDRREALRARREAREAE
jgi:hypothetical protein